LHYATEKFPRRFRIEMMILTIEVTSKKEVGGTVKLLNAGSKKSRYYTFLFSIIWNTRKY